MENLLPTALDYGVFLQQAASKFNISVNEARGKYGLFTYQQWDELLK
jgi:hypothetical protein